MKIGQKLFTQGKGWEDTLPQAFPSPPQLVLAFGSRTLMEDAKYFQEIRAFYPNSRIIECSTAGEILGEVVRDGSIAVTAVLFEKTQLSFAEADITTAGESEAVGKKLADLLPKENLVHAMVFSDGLKVNGTALVKGLNENLPPEVSVTGGLVGDGADFKKTAVGLDQVAKEGKVVLIGFSGTGLKIGYGSLGGWDAFGVERKITRSKGNILFELDGKPALELYKTYLGDKAAGLPGTGLLFPLRMRVGGDETEVVRTILGVNEADQSLTFAGDMPEGALVALMKANFERLIDGASKAGNMSIEPLGSTPPDLAILISCVGRKLVLKERIEEEIEAVRSAVGEKPAITGFYSYGELCPTASSQKQCRLHNQTMTITTFRED
ncbi:MAG TPA: FIST N-terminal domain-containing protein [Patescibacteria group bacterium]|nr:FIST N-terminal domain-containing protein [Patescibacteria group bacterium]